MQSLLRAVHSFNHQTPSLSPGPRRAQIINITGYDSPINHGPAGKLDKITEDHQRTDFHLMLTYDCVSFNPSTQFNLALSS